MANWRDQPELELPTLQCLALALRATGHSKQADEVAQIGISKSGTNDLGSIFKLYVAEDQVLSGNAQAASVTLKQINTSGWEDDSLALFYLVRGLARVQRAERSDRQEAFDLAQDRLRGVFRKVPIYKRDVFLRREYRRCLTRMAKASGLWSQGIRALWKSAESRSFIVPLLLIPGLQLFLPCYLYRLCSRRKGINR